ncbi:hypothetical protein XNC1_3953 [Xenorhabdus nematophila ATCC 19061]|uniref:Uncharacterized protein n=1 Tax=Xenorhabdus nematophila (strain ATCC 19061 / DSM 3370 / CCUG 14189 / LMG 1036 / NCIMB 9965 / AN6) TaxID=406817 RepID=D3VBZ2_XENNA|nr:hypothetical protein [Xenorhabdus nematophila]CBJ91981.1 hypothetical protein XNC1_3953 [Xenorhabdus nematophila ATCC 19061]CEK24799.1 hypothetical protein XNC2_3808 [Xenorhabdus nematophila AN6/1]
MKIKKRNELPDWFDIDEYEVLKSLNNHDMLSQLIVRRDWLKGEWCGFISVNTYNDIIGLYDDAFSKIIQPLDSRTFYKLRMGRKKIFQYGNGGKRIRRADKNYRHDKIKKHHQ